MRVSFLFILLTGVTAWGYEGVGLRREVDGGVHVPVLTRAPELTHFVEATLPPDVPEAGQTGEVGLQVDLDATGKVSAAEVTRSGGPVFDEAARAALLQFTFSPAEIDGAPASVRLEYVYHFVQKPLVPAAVDAGVEQLLPVNLTGHVLERGTRDPLANAVVFLPGSNVSAEADATGRFELRGVPAGRLKVEVTAQRHEKFSTEVEVREGQVTDLNAYLLEKLDGAFETTIISGKDKKDVSLHTFEKHELATVPGTFGDPLRVLQNMPGMARAPLLSGALLVRGAQPQDSQVLVDGVPIPLLYHLAGGPSVLSPSYIDRINFYPGAYGAKYGRAIAGIVDVETGGPPPTTFHGQASIDLLNAGFFLESPLRTDVNWGSLSIAARHSVIDFVLPPILKLTTRPGQASIVATPSYWDYQARYTIDLGGNAFELAAFGANDLLGISQAGTTSTQPFSLTNDQGFHRFRLRWSRKTDDGWFFFLAPTLGLTVNQTDVNDTTTITSNSTDFNLRGWAKKTMNRDLSFELGLDVNASWFHNRFEVAGTPTPTDENPAPSVHDQTLDLVSGAAYVEMVYSPIERWKWIPGVRLELYNLPSGVVPSLEPRLATRFRVTDWFWAKAAWGLYRQAPQSRELDAALGNPNLGLAMSQQTAGGFEFVLRPKLSLDVQGFFNWRTNLVQPSSTLVVRNGVTQREGYNNGGVGRAYGLEVLLKQDLTERFYGWVAYTLSRSENFDAKQNGWSPVSTDQTHILTVVASYRIGWGVEAGVRFRLTTGSPYTPVLGSTFNADTGGYSPVNGATNSAREATFNQLDLRVEKQFTFTLWKFSVYLDVQNVYDAPNPERTLYDYRYAQSAAVTGLPIIPSLGVKGEF